MLSDTDVENHYNPSIRVTEIEKNGTLNCGFKLTRGKFDPYPWVSSVDPDTFADVAGLKPGDCLLEVNGEDIIGKRISEVAEIVKSKPNQVSLLLWNPGLDPQCTPEAICCGPMPTNLQRLSACMSTILAFLECPVCLDTIPPPTYQCENGHLICIRCRTKTERCPVCRLRFNRARSLLSDQVYNSLVDAFNLREVPDDARTAKMAQIFKIKKNKNIPDIKITPSHTNKFLARLVGKSSSVDNLSSSKVVSVSNSLGDEFNLKTKSLSTQEIFLSENSISSRSGSMNRLSRNDKNKYLQPDNRPASYHGSFESLQRRSEDDTDTTNFHNSNEETVLFHCPFASNCTALMKRETIIQHFQLNHEGPLIQYFQSHVKIDLRKILKCKKLCYILQVKENTFFLEAELLQIIDSQMPNSENVFIWTWFLGDKKDAKEYDMQVKVISEECNDVIISVRNSVCSLNCISYQDVRDSNKGVLFNTKTIESLNSSTEDIVFDINILKNDYI